jgi:hypothetical protein
MTGSSARGDGLSSGVGLSRLGSAVRPAMIGIAVRGHAELKVAPDVCRGAVRATVISSFGGDHLSQRAGNRCPGRQHRVDVHLRRRMTSASGSAVVPQWTQHVDGLASADLILGESDHQIDEEPRGASGCGTVGWATATASSKNVEARYEVRGGPSGPGDQGRSPGARRRRIASRRRRRRAFDEATSGAP